MANERLDGTAGTVRTALEQLFDSIDPGDAAWRGRVGPAFQEVAVTVGLREGRPFATARGTVTAAPRLDGTLARAIAREHDGLLFGRFRYDAGDVIVEQAILGGATLALQEMRIAAWSVGWAAGAFQERFDRHLDGDVIGGDQPVPQVAPRRGADERIRSCEERVTRFITARYGKFERDAVWGFHGGFGSTRVFVTVRHTLEVSTAVQVAAPVLIGVDLTDALALDAHAIAEQHPLGRFSYSSERAELWCEHAILGDALDPEELELAMDAVAAIADGSDERLQAAHGGKRYADLT
jgi:hypothetical protein